MHSSGSEYYPQYFAGRYRHRDIDYVSAAHNEMLLSSFTMAAVYRYSTIDVNQLAITILSRVIYIYVYSTYIDSMGINTLTRFIILYVHYHAMSFPFE